MQSSPLRALGHYRILPGIVPASSLAIAAAARIPYSMIPLGAVTGMTWATGNIAMGGLTTAIVALSSTVASPLLGRLSDKIGTPALLKIFWPLSALATATLLCATIFAWTDWRLFAAAIATGATMVPIGALTRARWVHRHPDPRTLATAFSYETMVDELMFVAGPILVGLTSVITGWAPLAMATALIILAVGAFTVDALRTDPRARMAAQATTDASAPTTTSTSNSDRAGVDEATAASPAAPVFSPPVVHPPILRVLWAVAPAIGAMIAMGLVFGSTQTAMTERAISLGTPSLGGLWYGLMGLASAIASILVVLIPPQISAPKRVGVSATILTLTLHLASHIDSLAFTGAILFIGWFGLGTILVTSFASAEKLSPPGGIAVAMTAMPAAITVGVSGGSVIGGYAASMGSHVAFHAGTASAALAIVCALWLHLRLNRTAQA